MNKKQFALSLVVASSLQVTGASAADLQKPQYEGGEGLWGYIGMSLAASPPEYAYGVSMYSTTWPLLEKPLRDFQIGLCGTWIKPDNREIEYPLLPKGTLARDSWPMRGPSYRDVFQTIEGSLGFWGGTRFGSTTAKFRMNGTANGYNNEITSPGWGFGDTTALKPEQTGIAQISQYLLVPPDGLTFETGTTGDLFGYAWMALPLTQAMTITDGLPVPTGDQSWTMFANTTNFKGPVACYLPTTWSRISRNWAPAIGRGLDARPADVGGGAIEINTVPRFIAEDDQGTTFTRIPTLQFPVDDQNRTILMTGMTRYSKSALWDQVQEWIDGGATATGKFDMTAADTPKITANPLVVKQGVLAREVDQATATSDNGMAGNKILIDGVDRWVTTKAFDDHTFGLQWNPKMLTEWPGQEKTRRGDFPAYFQRDGATLRALEPKEVPQDTGLLTAEFKPAIKDQAYTSPTESDSNWQKPGPKAGPFTANLSDGSAVTYYWYRFIDQPSVLAAGFTADERDRLQAIVEKIQSNWTPENDYMAPPTTGKLATLDTALFVTPPSGLEHGYVPIATRQADQE